LAILFSQKQKAFGAWLLEHLDREIEDEELQCWVDYVKRNSCSFYKEKF
jgi:hypothetical protein